MKHPLWRCQDCGERLYEHIEGDYQCPNCGRRFDPSQFDDHAA